MAFKKNIFFWLFLLLRIITGKSNKSPKSQRQGEEDLGGSIQPNLRIFQGFPL